jgi:hypothetical protein
MGLAIIKRIVAPKNKLVTEFSHLIRSSPLSSSYGFLKAARAGLPDSYQKFSRRDITIARVRTPKRLANSDAAYAQADELMQPNVLASGLAATSGALQKASEIGWILFHLGFAHRDLRET